MNAMVAAQVAFCVLVLFVAGLFISTFQRLSSRPLGFAPQGLLIAETQASGKPQAPETWRQLVDRLRQLPGVRSAAWASWAPLTGNHWTGSVRIPGRAVDPRSPYYLSASPGYFETMRIGRIDGRDFRPGDVQPKLGADQSASAGVGIVNEAFARAYFDGRNPVGKIIEIRKSRDLSAPLEIVGYVRDACYSNVRETIRPTVYFPVEESNGAAILLRPAGDTRAFTTLLRREVSAFRAEFRVRVVETQAALVDRQMLRERLLATLSLFFAAVALALAVIGLYGVLNYGVVRQRREIGIRIALGARAGHVIRRVAYSTFAVVLGGAFVGLIGGIVCGRFVEALLYEVKPGDTAMLAAPIATLIVAALLAALPPALRAARIDPAQTLRE